MTEIDYQPEEFRSQTEIPNRPIRRIMCQEGNLGINKVMFTAESSMLFAKVGIETQFEIVLCNMSVDITRLVKFLSWISH